MSVTIYQDAQTPTTYQVVYTGDGTVDLTTVTAAEFHVRFVDGTTAVWAATRSAAGANTITLAYTLQTSDTIDAHLGKAVVFPVLTYPAGVLNQTSRDTIMILGRYQAP